MKIQIKTQLIQIIIEDESKKLDDYSKRVLPELAICIKTAIEEAVKLHNEVSKSNTSNP